MVVQATVLKTPDGMDEIVELAPSTLPLLLEVLTGLVGLLLLTADCRVIFLLGISGRLEMGTMVVGSLLQSFELLIQAVWVGDVIATIGLSELGSTECEIFEFKITAAFACLFVVEELGMSRYFFGAPPD